MKGTRLFLIIISVGLLLGHVPTAASQSAATPVTVPNVALELVADGLVDPVAIRAPSDGTDRLFVAEKIGRIRVIENGVLLDTPFIDLLFDTVSSSPEQGLYDIAFHPDFAANGLVYVSHTQGYLAGALVVWEYRVSDDDPNVADRNSRRPVIAIQRRAYFHNGGTLAFGPDGYLYIGVGEGLPYAYSWSPPLNLAQSLENLDGKILRIDVDIPRENDRALASYLVPENPFGGPIEREYAYRSDMDMMRGEVFPEIWAYGLRNPWNFAFDPETGDLYIPDVGEQTTEEINVQPAASPGGENYGWSEMEGADCRVDDCSPFTAPVHTYGRAADRCSVIGLAVSRTPALPSLSGSFLFADFCSGEIMALVENDIGWISAPLARIDAVAPDRQIAGGGSDSAGNVYVATCTCTTGYRYLDPNDDERKTGAVWQIVPAEGEVTRQSRDFGPKFAPFVANPWTIRSRVRRSHNLEDS